MFVWQSIRQIKIIVHSSLAIRHGCRHLFMFAVRLTTGRRDEPPARPLARMLASAGSTTACSRYSQILQHNKPKPYPVLYFLRVSIRISVYII